MAKFLRVVFSDNTVWDVPFEVIEQDRRDWYAKYGKLDPDVVERTATDELLMEWASNEMNWSDVKDQAIKRPSRTPDVDYEYEWASDKAGRAIVEAE